MWVLTDQTSVHLAQHPVSYNNQLDACFQIWNSWKYVQWLVEISPIKPNPRKGRKQYRPEPKWNNMCIHVVWEELQMHKKCFWASVYSTAYQLDRSPQSTHGRKTVNHIWISRKKMKRKLANYLRTRKNMESNAKQPHENLPQDRDEWVWSKRHSTLYEYFTISEPRGVNRIWTIMARDILIYSILERQISLTMSIMCSQTVMWSQLKLVPGQALLHP